MADAFGTLPAGISALQRLVHLQLYLCGVQALPESIADIGTLENLMIEGAPTPRSPLWPQSREGDAWPQYLALKHRNSTLMICTITYTLIYNH